MLKPFVITDKQSTQIISIIYFFFSLGIIIAGGIYYQNHEKQFRVEVERQLSAISVLKVNELVKYRNERLADGEFLYKNITFSSLVRQYFEEPQHLETQTKLQNWLDKFLYNDIYNDTLLLDIQGNLRMSEPNAPKAIDLISPNQITEVIQSDKVVFQDFYRDKHDGLVYLAILVPIFDEQDSLRPPLGIIVLRINPATYLYPFISSWPTPSQTAETLLIRRDGNDALFLNELKFQKGTALNLRSSLSKNINQPAVKAALGQEGIVEGLDYRGIPVIADVRAVPDSPWFIVARMDTFEVFQPLRERLWITIALIALLLSTMGAGLWLILRQQSNRFYRERYETQRKLAWLQEVVSHSLNEIFVFDPQTLFITFANVGACRNTGYSLEEFTRLTMLNLNPQSSLETFQSILQTIRKGEQDMLIYETEHQRKDGSAYPVEVYLQLVKSDTGEVFLALVNDISKRKLKDDELQEKNAELERFTYTISHDLKSPLVTIKTFLGYLEQDMAHSDEERIKKDMHFMHTATDKMSLLLDELLLLSRVGRVVNPPSRMRVNDLIQEASNMVAGQISKQNIKVTIQPSTLELIGDRSRLVEIWQNLLENATKFMGEQAAPKIEIGIEQQNQQYIFFVRDNGIGIDPRFQDKVFGLFEKLNQHSEGSGLGLALVKRIVELYHGIIWLESQGVGEGTCFRFTLPQAVIVE